MTLPKYWVCSLDLHDEGNELDQTAVYLAADVDRVVEELQKEREKVVKLVNEHLLTKRNPDDLEDAVRQILQVMVSEKGNADKLQADLARVTAELEKAKEYISGKYGLGIPYPIGGEVASAQREWKGDK